MRQFFFSIVVLALLSSDGTGQSSKSWINGYFHGSESITCDLPNDQQMRNIGSKLDGQGMCVFSAVEMAARYQGLEQMRGWRDWCAANYKGGGYPSKVDNLLSAWWKKKGIEPIPYLQFEGHDPEETLRRIDKTNRMACITYGQSPRYPNLIAHMVNCINYGVKYGVVLDNNFPGDDKYEWMEKAELVRRIRIQTNRQLGSAWVFVWLTPGSPPSPKGR